MSVMQTPEGRIDIRQLSIVLGQGSEAFEAVRELDCQIEPGQFVCILGPSGCGKSTLLGALAGHLRAHAGSLKVDGAAVSEPSPQRGMVFQHHTLFPWRTVRDNVAFGLKMRGIGKAERHRAADDILKLVGLDGFAERWPDQLSGGMQQRVEIARVLVNRPRLLLMDEPFGALDEIVRDHLNSELLKLWATTQKTIAFVTHSIPEAVYLSTKIVVMSPRPGRVTDVIESDLPAERPLDIRETPEFLRLAARVRDGLRAGHSYEE